ncbi:putative DUF788 domain-containing protein [Hamiltosporidium tvaerminnensis]|uniref:Putative DUF788 domain-containing protein n=2 Tax=Hamiltosporidium TaxID=1176354 RepID=A0A4Q9L0N4_9MICR|nr:putative DUF788 domain-containing protein [Hamiltosporidium magnivora]TBU00898.1 putative DUF788 domain-containing protein [Hamiltosporidium tvaerminnensis]TBU15320.1 putative DUF788 domain-containing protein [Hamiltosporidium tvaerminnensis]
MAGTSSKKILKRNNEIIKNLKNLETFVLIVSCILYRPLSINKIMIFIFKSFPELFGIFFIYKSGYRKEKDKEYYVSLDSKGIISMLFDFVYISQITKILTYFYNSFYFLYFILIISIVYEFYFRFKLRK